MLRTLVLGDGRFLFRLNVLGLFRVFLNLLWFFWVFMNKLLVLWGLLFLVMVFLVLVVGLIVGRWTILVFVMVGALTRTTKECDGCSDRFGGSASHSYVSLRLDGDAKGFVHVGIVAEELLCTSGCWSTSL